MRKSAQANNIMNALRDLDGELATLNQVEPQGWQTWTNEQKMSYLDDLKSGLDNTKQVTQKLDQNVDQKQQTIKDLSSLGVQPQPLDPSLISAKRQVFNLSKFSQMEMTQPELQSENTTPVNVTGVRQLLDGFVQEAMNNGHDPHKAKSAAIDMAFSYITDEFTNPNQISTDPISHTEGDSQQAVRDAVNTYYSSDDESQKDMAASFLARTIFPHNEENTVDAVQQDNVKIHASRAVKETDALIRKMASSAAPAKTFNLKKQAQHKSFENAVMFGPNNVRDEFTGDHQLINEWHLVERNKGWGLRLHDEYALNWEKVWRETVMDKYDPLYIERRFEVDKNVPPTNDIYLKPGQTRRITPPEYGITEARIEADRTKMNKDRGYSPASKGEVFNWKKAQSLKPLQAPKAPSGPFKEEKFPQQMHLCMSCKNPLPMNMGVPAHQCPSCGAIQNGNSIPGETRLGPAPAKTADIEKLAMEHDGIFFDSQSGQFIVVADKKKQHFTSYSEAAKFKALPQKPKKKKIIAPPLTQYQREVADHAHGLGIDG